MSAAIVTGSSGLIGSEAVRFLHAKGLDVVGIDNDMRAYCFGQDASVEWNTQELVNSLPRFRHHQFDIRDDSAVNKVFKRHGQNIELVVHCAAQPSHDWAVKEPATDFSINATGTLVLLEATREFCSDAVFIFTSTNKVYGDAPNTLPLVEMDRRWELNSNHPWGEHGIDEMMNIDQTKHSIFGASKVAADIMVQEYGRYFGMRTVAFRGGCLTGPAHSGAELHGFLAYLVRCAVTKKAYTIFGYKGKQVRDNIHSNDLVQCFWHFYREPKSGAVYNMGGSRHCNCSILEAIDMIEELSGDRVNYTLSERARIGDHMWWISDVRRFQHDYPSWSYTYDLRNTLSEMIDAAKDRYQPK
jgi:CDP-paratose 2-epimerase